MREGSSARDRLFEEGAIVSSILDQSIDDTRELGSDRAVPLAAQIGIQRVSTHVTIELAAQTVLAHAHRGLGRHPERRAQPSVAVLGKPADATEAARLLSREGHATELQKLAIVGEAPQVAGLGQNRSAVR